MSRARRRSSLYPLWLGALAFGGALAWWYADAASVEVAPTPDAGVDAAVEPAAAAPVDTEIVWQIRGRGPIEPGSVDVCLADAGLGRALTVGDDRLVVTYPGRRRPVVIAPIDDGLELTTPVEGDPRFAATLHVALTACLYRPDAAVVDPALDRRFTGAAWPQLGEGGGPPIEALVAIEAAPGGLVTRGLDRLQRAELGVAVSEGEREAAQTLLARAAAASVAAGAGAERLTLPGGAARLVDPERARASGWWTAPPTDGSLRVLADADGGALRPAKPAAPTPRAAPKPRPKPKPKPRAPAPRATPKPPAKTPAPGGFRPEYR